MTVTNDVGIERYIFSTLYDCVQRPGQLSVLSSYSHIIHSVLSYEFCSISPLNAKLNPICHLLALLGAHHILRVSRIKG